MNIKILFISLVIATPFISACGSGGGEKTGDTKSSTSTSKSSTVAASSSSAVVSSSSSAASSSIAPATLSVSLAGITVQRAATGESLSIDVSDVSNIDQPIE